MQARLLVLPVLFMAFAGLGACAEDVPVGLWTSEGYGLFLRIDSSRIVGSEITSVSCLPADGKAQRQCSGDVHDGPDGPTAGDLQNWREHAGGVF